MSILTEAKEYSLTLLLDEGCNKLPFHNLKHTQEVYHKACFIAEHEHLTSDELEILLLASIFHDVGQIDGYSDHEIRSAQIATTFLTGLGYDIQKTSYVASVIKATKMPQNPANLLEKIICDADLYHLGTTEFFTWNSALREEWELLFSKSFSDVDWLKLNLQFLKEHQYHTSYCQQTLHIQKKENIKRLEQEILCSEN